jgi:putative serine protease PepD
MVSGPPPEAPQSQPRPQEQAPPTVPFAPSGPGPAYVGPGPGPYAQPGYGRPDHLQHGGPARPRKLPLWVWPAVAALALVVGILGGLAGGALQDQLASERGTVDNGLEGVRTQTAAPLDAENGSVAAVAQALLPSTVQIVAEFGGEEGGATGSGFVLDREGHVVTNNHVVASAATDDGAITVIDHEGVRHEATVVGRSPVYDLAVLDVEDAESLEPAALGASQVLHVGDSVIAFGAPLGLSQTVTSGIVSALNRPVTTSGESDDESSYINAVQTDAAINPGNSGGPLVNLAGEVVGVNSAIATNGGGSSEAGNIGVGFAIPIEQVRTTVDQILRTGKAEYPVIGAQVRTGGEADSTGATITEVMPDTPAERAGLEKDDLITAVDDQPVSDGIALIVAIRTHLPGETVKMSVIRGGEEQVVEVELDGKVG